MVDGTWVLSQDVTMKPYASLDVKFNQGDNGLNAEFIGGGSTFTLAGPKEETSVRPEVGLDFAVHDRFTIHAAYDGDLSSNYNSNGFTLGVTARW